MQLFKTCCCVSVGFSRVSIIVPANISLVMAISLLYGLGNVGTSDTELRWTFFCSFVYKLPQFHFHLVPPSRRALSPLPGIHFILCLSHLFSSCPCFRPPCSRRMHFCTRIRADVMARDLRQTTAKLRQIFANSSPSDASSSFFILQSSVRFKNSANLLANAFSKYNYMYRPTFVNCPRNGIINLRVRDNPVPSKLNRN